MSENTAIEWTDSSWTPIRAKDPLGKWFCQKVSPGCDNCYASTFNHRRGGQFYGTLDPARAQALVQSGDIYLDRAALEKPLHWRKPRRIFLSSMTDIFGEWVSDSWLSDVFSVIRATPRHTYQILTKRPRQMRDWITGPNWNGLVLPNVWLGVSVELDRYTWRAKMLAETPAAVRFVSAEPLLGPLPSLDMAGISWVITGGESGGSKERSLVERCSAWQGDYRDGYWHSKPPRCGTACPCGGSQLQPKWTAIDWVRELRDRSQANGTAFFHKQWGGRTPKAGGRLLDGKTWDQYPAEGPR